MTGYDNIRLDHTGQAEAFDAIGDRYDEAFPHKDGQLAADEWLTGTLPAGSRVLDPGCGTGLPTARRDRAGRRMPLPGGRFALSMVEADGDDFAIPFLRLLRRTSRISGYPRDDLHQVVEAAGFEIVDESSYTFAPATSDVPPEEQIFLHCRRGGRLTSAVVATLLSTEAGLAHCFLGGSPRGADTSISSDCPLRLRCRIGTALLRGLPWFWNEMNPLAPATCLRPSI